MKKITREQANCFMPGPAGTVSGRLLGPLTGLTFAVKDLFDLEGAPTGAGSPEYLARARPARRSARAVQECLDAGGKCVGKTVMDEFAYSIAGRSARYGSPLNAAAPERLAGGSSSGSASAVAAGLADFALATDTGGSTRCPASQCGLIGLRPTWGRGSLEGCRPLAPSFDTCGLLAKSMKAFRRAFAVLYGPDEGPLPARPRLLLPADAWAAVPQELCEVFSRPLSEARALWGKEEEARLSPCPLGRAAEAFRHLQAAEAWRSWGSFIERERPALGPGVRERFAFAREAASEDPRPWREERSRIKAFLDEELAGGGLLVFPTLPGPGPLRSASDADMERFRASAFALLSPAGLAGLPSLSLPLGTLQGAPVGLTLLGPAGCDEWVLRCGCELMESLERPRVLFSGAGFAPIFFFL